MANLLEGRAIGWTILRLNIGQLETAEVHKAYMQCSKSELRYIS